MAVLTRLRHLMRDAVPANVDGLASFLGRVHLQGVGAWLKGIYALRPLHYWQLVLLTLVTIGIVLVSLVGWWALSRLLERMRGIPDVHKLDAPASDVEGESVGPVPVRFDNVRFVIPMPPRTRCPRSASISRRVNTSQSPAQTAPVRPR